MMSDQRFFDHGTPGWVDLGTSDPVAARLFYGALFGWEADDQGRGYSLSRLHGRAVAGIGPLSVAGQHSAWMTYMIVDDADSSVAKVKAAGGEVFLGPLDALNAGRLAVVADTTGAPFGLWQPRSHRGAEIRGEHGTMCWHELNTRRPISAASFYGAVFGWEAHEVPIDDGSSYTEWLLGDKSVCGMMPMDASTPAHVPPHWLVHFAVHDCDDSVGQATAIGATLLVEPMDVPPGRLAVLADPQGAAFAVIQLHPHQGADD
jgi:predicted enzyme related to lactoylglutathione lyase